MHQRQRHGAITVDEIHLGRGVFGDGFKGFQRLEFDVVGVLADGRVDFFNLIGLDICQYTALSGLFFSGSAFRLGRCYQLLLLCTETFQLCLLLLNLLLALLFCLNSLCDKGG